MRNFTLLCDESEKLFRDAIYVVNVENIECAENPR